MKWASFVIVFLILVSPVSAHVLKTSGTVGAVMHIDPDDDPIVGKPAIFLFDIKDKSKQFEWEKCGCRIEIFEGETVIFSDALARGGNSNVFKHKGIYKVRITGEPNFVIDYDVRVARVEKATGNWWQRIIEWIDNIFGSPHARG